MEVVDKIKTRVIGVNIDVARTTYAVVDIRGDIIATDHFQTSDYPEIGGFVKELCERIVQLVEANGGYESIRSVGISAPSGNFLTGCIENAANMPWKGVIPLAAMMRDQLGLAVAVANDAHITALGEKTFGSAHGMQDFVIVSLGHGGVGGFVFSHGQPHLGVNGFSSEVGHTCVVDNGRPCGCGRKGCLEQYASEKGLLITVRVMIANTTEPSLLRNIEDIRFHDVVDACEKGDALAIEAFRQTGFMLGLGLANFATVINPEAIILTGDATGAGKWLLVPMRKSFDEHLFPNLRGKVRLLVSILREGERDVLGASALAWDVQEYSLFK